MTRYDHTPIYNLKAVVQETGLKPDTLRAWERRYGLPHPDRTGGGHRLYSQYDIEMLKWLVARQEEGLNISRAVDLWRRLEAEGEDPLAGGNGQAERWRPAEPVTVGDALAALRDAWLDACLAFDEQDAERIVAQAFALYPPETVCFELLQKGLYEVGEGWYRGEITVQQEHFTSALAMRRVEALLAATPPPIRPGRILALCPPDERHTFGLLLLTFLLRRRGLEVIYLGANVPIAQLETTINAARPRLVVISAHLLHTAATLLDMAQFLAEAGIPMAYGGLVFNQQPELAQRIPGHYLGRDLQGVAQVVEQLLVSSAPAQVATLPPAECQEALVEFEAHQADIESIIWQRLGSMAHSHLTTANLHLGQNIVAALKLGSLDYLGRDLRWIRSLLINYHLPDELLAHYLAIYGDAAATALGEAGRPIVKWLASLRGVQ
jgi:DNA-binding transcriptional MerR regulator/methylmalonyl-CoA mutase cobalamin-binding subunit